MKHEIAIISTELFSKEFKRLQKKYPSIKSDLSKLIIDIRNHPLQGIDLGHNIRKIRFAITSKGKGKSGGARIITLNVLANVADQKIILVTLFDKGEIENISKEKILSIIDQLGF